MDDLDFDIENEWKSFLEETETYGTSHQFKLSSNGTTERDHELSLMNAVAPEPLPLYISTKSIITYLNMNIDIDNIFWKLHISPYSTMDECIIKKEIKLTSLTEADLNAVQEKIDEIKNNETFVPYIKEHIIININNPDGRIKFKNVKKLSIGVCKKDIQSCRSKPKGAFYNCLVMIIRIKLDREEFFREMHVKIFNTGKIEIPGIQSDEVFHYVCNKIIEILQPFITEPLNFLEDPPETVLINSNFNCKFFINRQKLFDILRTKYKLQCLYDSCYYPGIQCKFADEERGINNVSFMIFRTGSVLIVGKCNENDINYIYNYVKEILITEYKEIVQVMNSTAVAKPVKKNKTMRKKKIYITELDASSKIITDIIEL